MTENKQIRIMLVDDHAMVRRGLAAFLLTEDDFELVGEASNGQEALDLLPNTNPDVILMDLMMPEMDGPTAIKEISAQYPNINVLALTSIPNGEPMRRALQAGAKGYLLKNVSAEELARAIRDAHAGKPVLTPEATLALMQIAREKSVPPASKLQLTEREMDVLREMIRGKNNTEIAQVLVISVSTVKFHVSNVFNKLEVKGRVEAVTKALELRLLE